jgi:transposase
MSKSERESFFLQERRMRAGRMLLRGVPQAEVARRVAVTRKAVNLWSFQLKAGGLQALRRRQRGRPAGLTEQQRVQLMRLLTEGALAQGFPTELWTVRRAGQLMEEKFDRRYSESQVWRILVRLGFSGLRTRDRRHERDAALVETRGSRSVKTARHTKASSGVRAPFADQPTVG